MRDIARMLREQRRTLRVASPTRGTLPVATPAIAYPRARDDEFTATWIGHSTVLMQIGGLNVLTDPMFSQRSSPVQWAGPRRVMDPSVSIDALPPIDVVVQSHNHYDHFDRLSAKRIARAHPGAHWIVPLGVGATIRRWGARDVTELDWWQHTTVKSLRVTATPANHFSGRWLGDRNRSLWCGYALALDRWRALFVGDTAVHPAFGEIGATCGPFDFVMMPVGAYDPRWFMGRVHIDPEQAVQAFQDIIAPHSTAPLPIMLGIHWGTFRLTNEPMDEPPKRAAARWRAVGLNEDRLWIARFGETRIVVR